MCLPNFFKRSGKPDPDAIHKQPEDPSEAESIHQLHDFSKAEAIQPAPDKPTPPQTPAATPPSGSPPQPSQQLPPVAPGLPSQVDETLAACPRFRILVVGKSGIGKSSLIKNLFNIDPDQIDISHRCAGKADIKREYTSAENPRFILHDSQGFEAGSDGNWTRVESFLKSRQQNDLPGKIHAIWFCVETPLPGSRLLHRGDESLLKLAKDFRIPIIAVFTKYDLLETQFFIDCEATPEPERSLNVARKASESFGYSVNKLEASIPCVKVSTKKELKENEYLINLTKVTRDTLQNVEEELEVLWVAAQQVNARQKVEVSISEGFKKYWVDLGQSSAFEGKILIDCIHRIHDDILKVWNFNDPTAILSSTKFFTTMIGLVKPLIEDKGDETFFLSAHVPNFGSSGAKLLVPLLQRVGLNDPAINYLYDKYQQYPSTAKLLSTYIINLILVLYGVFSDILPSDPPRPLSNNVVSNILTSHEGALKQNTLDRIDLDPAFAAHPEKVIQKVILQRLPAESARSGM